MSRGWSYVSGEWWVSCDVCQTQVRASEAKHRWDGLITCPDDFEERHPQDFVRVKPESYTLPFTRPEPADVFSVACDLVTSSGYAGLGRAGCMRASFTVMDYNDLITNYL